MSNACNVSFLADPLEPKTCDQQVLLIFEAVFLGLVILTSVTANSFVLFLVARHKRLRYVSMMISTCGVIVDLLMTGAFHVPALVSASNMGWAFGYHGCQIIGGISYYVITVRWMIMAVISLDRIGYIMFPFSYRIWSKPYAITLIISAWVVPLFMSVPVTFSFGVFTYRTSITTCAIDCEGNRLCQLIHTIVFGSMYTFGVIVPCCLYIAIVIIAKSKRRRIRMGVYTDDYLPSPGTSARRGTITTRGSIFSNSNANSSKGIILLIIIFICFITTNTPLFVMISLRRTVSSVYMGIPLWGHLLISNLFYLSNAINPALILVNKDFRTVIYNSYCKRKPKAYRSRSLTTIRRSSVTPSIILRD